jgi:ABC-type spermidine/putrescine transport system permease subunit I
MRSIRLVFVLRFGEYLTPELMGPSGAAKAAPLGESCPTKRPVVWDVSS